MVKNVRKPFTFRSIELDSTTFQAIEKMILYFNFLRLVVCRDKKNGRACGATVTDIFYSKINSRLPEPKLLLRSKEWHFELSNRNCRSSLWLLWHWFLASER